MDDKKLAAILAATRLYLQQEEEAAPLATEPAGTRLANELGQWAQAGRFDQMGMRRMMQLRAISNVR